MEWLFDGIGTEAVSILISLFIGAGAGGTIGYKIGINRSILNQEQKAGSSSKQKQEGNTDILLVESGNIQKSTSKVMQKQKAGKGASQTQIGGVKSGK